jgi:hypothetical protein
LTCSTLDQNNALVAGVPVEGGPEHIVGEVPAGFRRNSPALTCPEGYEQNWRTLRVDGADHEQLD